VNLLEIEKLAVEFIDLTSEEEQPMLDWDELWKRRKVLKQQMTQHLLADKIPPRVLLENLSKVEEQLRTHY
jgi:hypothetical protein